MEDTNFKITNQVLNQIENLCDVLIRHLDVDEWDLDQIQKRIFRLGYNETHNIERSRSDVFKIMYQKISEMKPTKPIPKGEPINNSSDSSDNEDD